MLPFVFVFYRHTRDTVKHSGIFCDTKELGKVSFVSDSRLSSATVWKCGEASRIDFYIFQGYFFAYTRYWPFENRLVLPLVFSFFAGKRFTYTHPHTHTSNTWFCSRRIVVTTFIFRAYFSRLVLLLTPGEKPSRPVGSTFRFFCTFSWLYHVTFWICLKVCGPWKDE